MNHIVLITLVILYALIGIGLLIYNIRHLFNKDMGFWVFGMILALLWLILGGVFLSIAVFKAFA